MWKVKQYFRELFDVRPGERLRTALVGTYLMLVLFAYYILKPVSRAVFLNKFDIDKLPLLTILIAMIGGVLAYFYTRLAVRSSLARAVTIASIFSAGVLVLIWWLLPTGWTWVIYFFSIWVSLFSIVLVSQGWLIAANVFNPREAKRLYGILGVGAVIGAAFGGEFTRRVVKVIGTNNLTLASAGMVLLSYGVFLLLLYYGNADLQKAKAASDEDAVAFSFLDILGSIKRYRHLQVIIGIITITYLVDVIIDFQFSAMAKNAYRGDDLTAFLGSFYGLYLNLITFVLQLFLTALIVSRFGVGGTLQIMPIAIAVSSLATLIAPGVYSTAGARLAEAATRYSFNRTGMELLYLPLPQELKNRTKAFVDIFTDRLARGLGGLLLVLLTTVLDMETRHVSYVTLALSAVWMALSIRAKNEYILTVRRRLETRRLDLSTARMTVSDPATLALLDKTLQSENPRQVAYAVRLLADARHEKIAAQLENLVSHPSPEVRAAVFKAAREVEIASFVPAALAQIRQARPGDSSPAIAPAVQYALHYAATPDELAGRLLDHANPAVAEVTAEFLVHDHRLQNLLTPQWIYAASADEHPARRVLAAIALRAPAAGEHTDLLTQLLNDPDSAVVTAAARTAGLSQRREYLFPLVRRLAHARTRGAIIDALASYGDRIAGTLGDLLYDEGLRMEVRRQVPRALARIPAQRSVDVLLHAAAQKDLAIRAAALRALSKLRDAAPNLQYSAVPVTQLILEETRQYYEYAAALAPLKDHGQPSHAARLLVRTMEDRLQTSLERVFRLLGLRYPPREIYAAYLAVNRRDEEDFTTAMEFLDNVVDHEMKRYVLPLLDDGGRLADSGRELFGVTPKTVPGALLELLRSGDSWLVSCAIAAAADLGLRELAEEIRTLAGQAGKEVAAVARQALPALS